MKLTSAQKKYINDERAKMAQREKDLRSLGDHLWHSKELSAELGHISFRRGIFNMIIELHNVEIADEKARKGTVSSNEL